MSDTRTPRTQQQMEVDTDPLTAILTRLAATQEKHTALLESLVRQQEEQGRTLAALLRGVDDNPGAMVRAVSGAMRDLVKTQERQGYALIDVMGDVRAVMRAVRAREPHAWEARVAAGEPVTAAQPRIDRRRLPENYPHKNPTAAKTTSTPPTTAAPKTQVTASSLLPKPASLPPKPTQNQAFKTDADPATTSSNTGASSSPSVPTSADKLPPANPAYCASWNSGTKLRFCKALNCPLLHKCFVCHPTGRDRNHHRYNHRHNPLKCNND